MFYKGNEMLIEYFDPELFDTQFRPQNIANCLLQLLRYDPGLRFAFIL